MIDIETEVFNYVATKVREVYPNIYITGEKANIPSKFPSISIVEVENVPCTRTQTTDNAENHANLVYEVNVFTNRNTGKKSECRKITSLVSDVLSSLGFWRVTFVPDLGDENGIYTILTRYRATVSEDKVIYRR